MSVTNYAVGHPCTWHGPLEQAGSTNGHDRAAGDTSGETFWRCCPICAGPVTETSAELFHAAVKATGQNIPDYEGMIAWGQGKCFPDFDTLQNAYRQAMEE